jgi:hypothetical protein
VLFSYFAPEVCVVVRLMSWKRSFDKLADESALAKRKKQVLDGLLENGRISRPTYDVFGAEIDETVAEIEREQNALLEKMNCKIGELEDQVRTLEILLANFEIQHVAGEVSEDLYQREIGLLSVGLDTARQELNAVKEAASRLPSGTQLPTTEVSVQEVAQAEDSEKIEARKPDADVVEEPVIVQVAESPSDAAEKPQETQKETSSQVAETKAEEETETEVTD